MLKQVTLQTLAGGSAGFIEVCVMHPLDVVKTRLQLQTTKSRVSSSDPNYYTGLFDCWKKMAKHEGLTSFWKGILPPILAETPKRAVKFVTYEQFKPFFMFGSSSPTLATYALAGLFSGFTEGILVNPFEVVKVTLQSNKALAALSPSTWSVTRQIVRDHGLGSRGLYKGLSATMIRNGMFNMVYFGFYHSVNGLVPPYQDPFLDFARKATLGFASGVLGSCVNIPVDVAKSRIQGPQPNPNVVKYTSTTRAILLVYREEGLRALYKGLLPKVLRLGPGGAIMLVVYDYVYAYLDKKYN